MKNNFKTIAVMTSGGDAPGINAKGIAQHPEIPLFAFHVKSFAEIVNA